MLKIIPFLFLGWLWGCFVAVACVDDGYVLRDPADLAAMKSNYEQFRSEFRNGGSDTIIQDMKSQYSTQSKRPALPNLYIEYLRRKLEGKKEDVRNLRQQNERPTAAISAQLDDAFTSLFTYAKRLEAALHGRHSGLSTRKATPAEKQLMIKAAFAVGEMVVYEALAKTMNVEDQIKERKLNLTQETRLPPSLQSVHLDIVNSLIRKNILQLWQKDYESKGASFPLATSALDREPSLDAYLQSRFPSLMNAKSPEESLPTLLNLYANMVIDLSPPDSLKLNIFPNDGLMQELVQTNHLRAPLASIVVSNGGLLTDEGVRPLIPYVGAVKEFTLHKAEMSGETFRGILRQLAQNSNLRKLSLYGCRITSPVPSALPVFPTEWKIDELNLGGVVGLSSEVIDWFVTYFAQETTNVGNWKKIIFPNMTSKQLQERIASKTK
jgi:hypothetical protein